jgi:hypothetical protein
LGVLLGCSEFAAFRLCHSNQTIKAQRAAKTTEETAAKHSCQEMIIQNGFIQHLLPAELTDQP